MDRRAIIITADGRQVDVEWDGTPRSQQVAKSMRERHGEEALDALLMLAMVRANDKAKPDDLIGFAGGISEMTGYSHFFIYEENNGGRRIIRVTESRKPGGMEEEAANIAARLLAGRT